MTAKRTEERNEFKRIDVRCYCTIPERRRWKTDNKRRRLKTHW